ncbi:MAG: lysophospholipid acyltransferase family protein [Hahellaceae bacterium]|nr:lysophospholipid acyltransferase family protein [Hahellaceae bacterium]MCP5210561.1 lysophospholipid acyltransferase family protein [Hahellaceae bacterium]
MEKIIVAVGVFLMKILALLPLRVNQFLGACVGWLIWGLKLRAAKITCLNIDVCYPRLSIGERKRLARRSVIETTRTMLELAYVWFNQPAKVLAKVVEVDGGERLQRSREAGRGVMLLGPHLGNWEVTGLHLASKYQMASMYKPPKMPDFEKAMSKARGQTGAELVPTTQRGVARLLSILKRGGMVGILPDQVPVETSAEFAPFFGREAHTMVLVSKILQKVDVDVFTAYSIRLPHGRGFRLCIRPVDKAIFDADLRTSLTALNHAVELAIADAVPQYQWEYKRFRRIAPGQEKIY